MDGDVRIPVMMASAAKFRILCMMFSVCITAIIVSATNVSPADITGFAKHLSSSYMSAAASSTHEAPVQLTAPAKISGQGYLTFGVWCGSGVCTVNSGNALVLGISTQINTCYKNTRGTYTFSNATQDAVTNVVTQYSFKFSDAACTKSVGTPSKLTYPSTCTTLPTFAGCAYSYTYATALPTNPTYNAVITKEYVQPGCTDATGPVSSIYMACNVCVNYQQFQSYAAQSVIYACSGTSYTGANYLQPNCAGTPQCFSGNMQTCGNAPSSIQPTVDNPYENSACQPGTGLGTPLPTVCTAASTSSGSGAAPAAAPTSSSSCFAATELLTLESGATKAISEVAVGDRVLTVNAKTGAQVYSDVAYLPHGQNTVKAVFTVLSTESGRDVKMTANHVLPAGACGLASLPYVAASSVVVGDCVQTVSGRERVVSVSTVAGAGVYTVIAMEELIVVNGIVATPYGGVNPTLANVYYNLHRLAYQVYGAGAMKQWVQAATEMLWGTMSL